MGQDAQQAGTILQTQYGSILQADCLEALSQYKPNTVDLVMTSPPFGLVRKKEYGNVAAEEYPEWFKSFGAEFHRILKDSGSLVIDIGGSWNKGTPGSGSV